jgi:phosphoserine phosphatase
VRRLHAAGRRVHLVSGGFLPLIAPVAARLAIPAARITANRLLHRPSDGAYEGLDPAPPTAAAGGKARAVAAIRAAAAAEAATAGQEAGAASIERPVAVMVGDGATDAEAVAPGAAAAFVGYGGVVDRPAVRARADWYITDLRELLPHL